MVFWRKFGGEVEAAKGLSDARLDESVTSTASILGPLVKAAARSSEDDGVPFMIVRPGVAGMEEGLRASAVTVCFFERASARTRLPVLPDAPRMRKCIFAIATLYFGGLGLIFEYAKAIRFVV